MTRAVICSEIGREIQCSKCKEFWPEDPEFYFFAKGRAHSWCKACYVNDSKTIAKRERWALKVAAKSATSKDLRP